MNTGRMGSALLQRVVHWSARVTSLLLFGLVSAVVIGNGGPPNVIVQPWPVKLEFAAIGLMLVGLLIGWVREGLGGLLVIIGLVAFNLVELSVNGRLAQGAFPLFAVPGVLFLLSKVLCSSNKKLPAVGGT